MSAAEVVARSLRPDLQGQEPYGAPQLDVPVRLNTNENSYAVPQPVVAAITAAVADSATGLNRYPDREFTALRDDLAAYLLEQSAVAVTREQIWAGNGSNEVLLHLVQAFGGPGRVALGFTPAYSMHPIISRTAGTTWVDGHRGSPTGAFNLDADDVVAQVRQARPHLVFLCSPNNPTGTALPLAVVQEVLEATRTDYPAIVVVDEAYAEFARAGTPSALTLLTAYPNLVVTRTMSKAFALAGGRVGYLAAAPELVDALRLVRLPYHLSSQTQAIARAAIANRAALLAEVEAIKRQRDRIVDECAALGFPPVASDANFVLFGGLADQARTWQALLDRGVLVRDVGIDHHLRVTAGTPEETTAFLEAMARLDESHRQARASVSSPAPAASTDSSRTRPAQGAPA
ncbi:MAG: histidinol-phosphate transaminase [Actinomycetales bacterium]|nr:MAG: histidinol-phosphate transaminase [Actinomycetales bacterium]